MVYKKLTQLNSVLRYPPWLANYSGPPYRLPEDASVNPDCRLRDMMPEQHAEDLKAIAASRLRYYARKRERGTR